MKSNRKIDIDSIDQFSGEKISWEVDGADATYLGKVVVILVVAAIVL